MIEGVKHMHVNLVALICGMFAILCGGFSLGMAVSNLLNRSDSKKKSHDNSGNADENAENSNRK